MLLNNKDAVVIQFGLIRMALAKLLEKRIGYSGPDDPYANLRTSEAVGVEPWRGVMVRCMDKIARRRRYMDSKGSTELSDEKWADPYLDHINYLCIEAGLTLEEMKAEELVDMLYAEAEQLIETIKAIAEEIGFELEV